MRDLTVFRDPTTTRGDLLTRDSTPKPARLAIGTADQVLAVAHAGSDPVWQTVSTLLDNLFGSAQGDLLYRGASTWVALAPGTSGQFLKTLGPSANPTWASVTAGLPSSYVYGLALKYLSTTTIQVGVGRCRDALDASDLIVTSPITVTYNSSAQGSTTGLDTKSLTGTFAVTSGQQVVTGTGTAFLTDFAPGGTPRVLTGTLTVTNGATAVTGSGTKFTTEVAVYDLIGTATAGYAYVASIQSDTALTLGVALPNAGLAGIAANVLEQCFVYHSTAWNSGSLVQKITSNTSLIANNTALATVSGGTLLCGQPVGGAFAHVWLTGASTAIVSTQRTKPLSVSSGYRRIGSLQFTAFNTATEFTQRGVEARREYFYQAISAVGASTWRVLGGGTSTTWADVSCGGSANTVPPTANRVRAALLSYNGTVITWSLRPRGSVGAGDTDLYAYLNASGNTVNVSTSSLASVDCDGAGYIQYRIFNAEVAPAGSGPYIDVFGYEEDL